MPSRGFPHHSQLTTLHRPGDATQSPLDQHESSRTACPDHARLRALFEATPVPCYVWQAVGDDFILVDYNETAVRVSASRVARFRGVALSTLAQDVPELTANVRAVAEDGSPRAAEFVYTRRRDGGAMRLRATFVRPSDGLVAVYAEDVAEQHAASVARRESEARFRSMFEHSLSGMAITSIEGRWLRVNRALCDMLGYDEAYLLEHGFALVTHPEDLAPNMSLLERCLRGEIPGYRMEKRYLHRDGHTVWAALNASLVRDADGTPLYLVAQMHDVTAQKETELALAQARKMEAVGRVAGGVAHDFNNLLCVVRGHAELLEQTLEPGDERASDAEEIRRAADRGAALTQQLLAFSRRQVLEPRVVSLDDVVDGVLPMLGRLIGANIRVERDRRGDGARILADAGQLEQVVMNLVLNARDAMPSGGVLRIVTSTTRHAPVNAHCALPVATEYALLSISDDGIGIDPAIRDQIFDPFFTTKPAGHGTGLGLATVYGIVQQSGGCVMVESAPGDGATFHVYFPAVRGEAAAATPSPVAAAPVHEGGTGTILLVEDEPAVRSLVERVLARSGYRVIATANGAEALERAAAEPRIDLVVTDVMMPGLSGAEVVRRVSALRPGVRALFISGFAEDDALHGAARPAGASFLHKPFTTAELQGAVRAALEPDPSASAPTRR